jgi:hypothetical protein
VNKDSSVTNGRWRNGSLVVQAIRADHFAGMVAGDSALDLLTVQSPTDMYKSVVLSNGNEVLLAEDLNGDGDTNDDTSPLYEVYGGLVASGQTEFLYESTLFWHYGDVAKLVLGKDIDICYGEDDWNSAQAIERGGVPLIFFNDLLIAAGFVDVEGLADLPALIAAFDALDANTCKTISEKNGGCKKEYEALLKLVELSRLVDDGDDTNNGLPPSTGLEGAGTTPVVIEGAVTSGGITSGPNFQSGRRTWIDILPEE